ncbi:MAG: hypothetical protein QOH31_6125 [Verrucomicrobiota bacterium]|jgi:hypothetical protein
MKTAFYTFLGVVAAGIVLFALYIGWQRLDRWEQGKNYWIAQLSQAQINTSPVIPGLSSEDYQRQIDELDGQLRVHQRAGEQLRLYLDNKPFRLPLTSTERKIRAGLKGYEPTSSATPRTSVTTREDVSIQTRSGSVTIPKGSTLPFTYRNNSIVRIRYQNEDYEIPIPLTDLE